MRTLAYSDIFDYPLTAEEIWQALPIEATLADVQAELSDGILTELTGNASDFYFLDRREHIVAIRERRRLSSETLRRRARPWGMLISRLPFVRMVAITGSLAVDNADAGEDVDYLIVTKPGRVWTARAFAIAVVHLARFTRIELCPNFLVAADALKFPEADAYVARELIQMKPVSGPHIVRRMLDENGWWRTYLPNASEPPAVRPSTGGIQKLPELLLGGRVGDALERAILKRKGGELRRLAGGSSEAVFDESMCKGHLDGHRQRIQTALEQRLNMLGIEVR